jgi:hypothetical protein
MADFLIAQEHLGLRPFGIGRLECGGTGYEIGSPGMIGNTTWEGCAAS